MNMELLCIVLIILLLLVKPNFLNNVSQTFIGRLIFVILIVVASCYKTYLGILLVIFLVILNQDQLLEGMSDNSTCGPNNCKGCDASLDSSEPNCNSYINDCQIMNGKCEDKKSSNSVEEQQNAQSFRQTNCNGNQLYKDSQNTNVSPDDVESLFPNVKFSDKKCNPCDPNCQFVVTKGNEQLTVQENLRPQSSKLFKSGMRSSSTDEPKPTPSIKKSGKNNLLSKSNLN